MKERVYAVMWDKEGEVSGSAAGEEGENENGRGAQLGQSWWAATKNQV